MRDEGEDLGPRGTGAHQRLVFELIELDDAIAAEPITFRNDFAGALQDVYDYDDQGRRTRTRPRLKAELKGFAQMWPATCARRASSPAT